MELKESEAQRAKKEVYAEIKNLYIQLRKEYPEASNHRIITTIADKVGYTAIGVYGILKKMEII